MIPDVRYYAITRWGRQRLPAANIHEACACVSASESLRTSTTKIVREERKEYEWVG
jgi:hypothetical protein